MVRITRWTPGYGVPSDWPLNREGRGRVGHIRDVTRTPDVRRAPLSDAPHSAFVACCPGCCLRWPADHLLRSWCSYARPYGIAACAEKPCHHGHNCPHVEGLAEEHVGPCLACPSSSSARRDDHEFDVAKVEICADDSAEGQPINTRHRKVENRHIWTMLPEPLQRVMTIGSLDHLVVVQLQPTTYQPSNPRLIIGDQNPQWQNNSDARSLSVDSVSQALGISS